MPEKRRTSRRLIVKGAGHVFGLDGLIERMHMADNYPALRPLLG